VRSNTSFERTRSTSSAKPIRRRARRSTQPLGVNVEALSAWLPLEGMEEELFLETARCDLGRLRVTLSRGQGSNRTLVIDFGEPQAFRYQPQHVFLNEPWWGKLTAASLYVVENSKYRAWLQDSTLGIFNQASRHYRIITVDGALDVLTLEVPAVSWISPTTVAALPPNKSLERTRDR
jgi:hypothetical protein